MYFAGTNHRTTMHGLVKTRVYLESNDVITVIKVMFTSDKVILHTERNRKKMTLRREFEKNTITSEFTKAQPIINALY